MFYHTSRSTRSTAVDFSVPPRLIDSQRCSATYTIDVSNFRTKFICESFFHCRLPTSICCCESTAQNFSMHPRTNSSHSDTSDAAAALRLWQGRGPPQIGTMDQYSWALTEPVNPDYSLLHTFMRYLRSSMMLHVKCLLGDVDLTAWSSIRPWSALRRLHRICVPKLAKCALTSWQHQ